MSVVIITVKVPVYGLPSRGMRYLVSLATKHIDDGVVAKKMTCNQKKKEVMTSSVIKKTHVRLQFSKTNNENAIIIFKNLSLFL